MNKMDRRDFLTTSAGAAAGALAPAVVTKAFGKANDRIRVAVVGVRGQGRSHIRSILPLAKEQNVEIAALCDIDESVLAERMKELDGKGLKPATFTDVRRLLDDKSIDAVSIATPNHWHALGTIWACQAGKDVYIEKPASHNVFEGKKMVEAARKHKRIVQVGTQSRSNSALQEAMQKIREGVIGDVYMARALCYKWRDTIGRKQDEAAPAGVHYDLWLGPAPKRNFNPNRFHYNWHWNWEYGNGDIGNQGIHEIDIARWGLGANLPTKASAMGGHFMFDDDQNTPNTQIATLEYHDTGRKQLMVIEVRHWISNHEAGIGEGTDSNTIGNIFYGSKGYLAIDGYNSYKTFLGREQTPGPSNRGSGSHHANFFTAMRGRTTAELTADIVEGHRSAVAMHLANISYRVGDTVEFDPAAESVKGNGEAAKLMTRDYREPFAVREKV